MSADVLFIHPGNQKRVYQDLSKNLTAIATPVWTALLAERVRRSGLSAAIYDVQVEGWDDKVPGELLAKHSPALVVLMVYGHTPSASTQTMPAARMIAADIKGHNKDVPVAMGGLHPSALPERTLREEPVDFVIQGEGAYTIEALARGLKGSGSIDKVPGLWRRDGDALVSSGPAPVVKDLDAELPGYAWDLLPGFDRYRAHNMHCFQDFERSTRDDFLDVRAPYVSLNTSLGCPYACHYCCINAVFGRPGIRYWSLDRVLSWLDALAAQGVRNVRFDDELFILSPKRVEEFCDRLIERKLDLNFWVYGRVDTVREGLLKKLKKAGVNWICLGIEAGDKKVREGVNKKIRTDIESVVAEIRRADIYVLGNYMFGLPDDDLSTMEETLSLARRLECEFANFYTVMAYPGSRLYDSAAEQGLVPGRWEAFSQHGYETRPLPTKTLPAAEVLRFRDEAFIRYHEDPKYLKMVEGRFGGKVLKHLEDMLKIRVKRRLTSEETGKETLLKY